MSRVLLEDEDLVGACVIESAELVELFGGVIGATATRELKLLDEDGKVITGHDKKVAQVSRFVGFLQRAEGLRA